MLNAHLRRRLAAMALLTAAATAAGALVLPAPTLATGPLPTRERAVSAHDATAAKSATATCPPGLVVLGAGGQIVGGAGGVTLAAVVPDAALRSVTAHGEAQAGHHHDWSVVAVAVCGPAPNLLTRVQSPPASGTATCPGGTPDLIGTGFALPGAGAGAFLRALIPDLDAGSVTVRAGSTGAMLAIPVAYAICGWTTSTLQEATGPTDAASPKTSIVASGKDPMYGVGGEVTGAAQDVFIDGLMPAAGLRSVGVRATRLVSLPVSARFSGSQSETWSVTGYGIETSDYY